MISKKKVAIATVAALMASTHVPYQVFASDNNSSDNVTEDRILNEGNYNSLTLDSDIMSDSEIENLDIEITEFDGGRQVDVLKENGDLLDSTKVYDNGLVVYTDNFGNTTESNVSDYATVIGENKIVEEDSFTTKASPDEMSIMNASQYSTLYATSYSSAWGMTGYLYGQSTVTEGPTTQVQFSAGAAVGAIVGIIAGVALPPAAPITVSVLSALGASILGTGAGAYIDTRIDGEVYARTTDYDYEVVANDEVGLVTNTTVVEINVANTNSAGASWHEHSRSGDTRSRDDIIHAGIYSVYLANN